MVYCLDRSYALSAFKAYTRSLTHVVMVKSHNLLHTVGTDDDAHIPILRVWKRESGASPADSRYDYNRYIVTM
jgi:hypothetical protein